MTVFITSDFPVVCCSIESHMHKMLLKQPEPITKIVTLKKGG